MKEIRNRVKQKAMENITKAQERQKQNYDRRHEPLHYEVGDAVLLRNMENDARKGGKLQQDWSGPYVISKVLPKGLYKLKDGDRKLKRAYNSTRLKIYHHPRSTHDATREQPPPSKRKNHSRSDNEPQPKRPYLNGLKPDDLELSKEEKEFNDSVIQSARRILREQFPEVRGWQDPVLCQTQFVPVREAAAQIHYTGKQHWVCSTFIGGLRVYDSSGSKTLTSSMKVQLTEIYGQKNTIGCLSNFLLRKDNEAELIAGCLPLHSQLIWRQEMTHPLSATTRKT